MRLTETEYEALIGLVTRGEGEVEALHLHEWQELPRRFRQGFKRLAKRGAWHVEDRRKPRA